MNDAVITAQLEQDTSQHHLQQARETFPCDLADGVANCDEDGHPDYIGKFHKRMPYDANGVVDLTAWQGLFQALADRACGDAFEVAIHLQRTDMPYGRSLVSPRADFWSNRQNPNSDAWKIPPARKVNSAECAAGTVERYWMALLREIPFSQFNCNKSVYRACADINRLQDFRGPKTEDGYVTPSTLFRGSVVGGSVALDATPPVPQHLRDADGLPRGQVRPVPPTVPGTRQSPERASPLLKAWCDESYVLPSPVRPSADGLALDKYDGLPLTVGGDRYAATDEWLMHEPHAFFLTHFSGERCEV